jgi:hypothetical protein
LKQKFKNLYDYGEALEGKYVNSEHDSFENKFYKLVFRSNFNMIVEVAVKSLNLNSEWETLGFYSIEPNEVDTE